jgi:EAL domain-containing protein (putative c-di-GMP-specific phosphodiesterase class I)
MGVAVYPNDGTDPDVLWRSADAAMYRAKRSGGNQYLFVSREISTSASENAELEMHMRSALKTSGFELYYQPQYTIDGHLCGLEALLRMHHPRLGLVQPDRFIPIAEESGLIVPIGNWVLEEVCRQSMEWRQQDLPQMRIALNVSFLQFMRTDFSTQVRQALARSGMPAHFLELEMTETTVMRNLENVARQMDVLAGTGVRFSVDDFGTGYSSLRHLHQLPISTLKIDRSFIEGICDRNGTYSIVQATLSLAHNLGMQVVAEGVENGEQMAALKSLGCDMLQGFFFSPPRRATELPALLLAGSPVSMMRDRPNLP